MNSLRNVNSVCFISYVRNAIRIIFIILLASSCHSSIDKDNSFQITKWFNAIDLEIDRIGITRAMHSYDSLIHTLDFKSIPDHILYYQHKRTLSLRDSAYAKDASCYTDSILHLLSSPAARKRYAKQYAKALLMKGDDLSAKKDYSNAYKSYYEGKLILVELAETCEHSHYSSRIATISYQEGKYYQAIDYWQKELQELSRCQDTTDFELMFVEHQGSLSNIGIAYMYLNQLDSAQLYYRKALDFIHREQEKFPTHQEFIAYSKLVIMSNQAEAYAMAGKVVKAERLFKKCLKAANQMSIAFDNARVTRIALSKLYIATRQYKKAGRQLRVIKASLKKKPNQEIFALWQRLNGKRLLGQKRYKRAAEQLNAYADLQYQRILKERAENKVNVGQILAQIEQQQQAKLTFETQRQQKLFLALVMVIAIALGVIIFLLRKNAIQARKNIDCLTEHNQTVSQKNMVLEDTVKALEQLQVENERVLKLVAHDLRNPIGAMSSASLLLFLDKSPDEEQQQLLSIIEQSSANALSLVSQILLSSTQITVLKKEPIVFAEVIQSCLDMLRHKALEKQQIFTFTADLTIIEIDREKMWRVVSNLLTNAIKFSDHGQPIVIKLKQQSHSLVLRITDFGIGIPLEQQAQIFDSLESNRRVGTSGEPTFGLGLAICKQIVAAHQGKIWVESKPQEGSSFFIELPLV